ncbi:MAG: comEC rec2 [Dehalococcoidales bacterium]|nr:comEC rec2 [Dehalococcoidales bacterium]
MLLIYLSFAWIAGIWLGSRVNLPLASLLIGLIPLPLLFLARHQKKVIILTSLCLIALLSGIVYFPSRLPILDQHSLQFYNDRGILEVKGIVDRDPEIGDQATRLHLSAREIKIDEGWRQISGNALVVTPGYLTYSYGDLLLVRGKIETPPQSDSFDYRGYLANQEIYAMMSYPGINVLERGQGSKLLAWVYALRNQLSLSLARVLPEPQAALAQGIILGIRSHIPSSVNADFVSTGTAHILAISGQNLSIVVGILVSLGIALFGRKGHIYVWLSLAAIWFYTLLTGMNPPVVRATIMASLFLAAELLGRQRSGITALAFAGATMVGLSPRLLWDASFQMSFMAMVGLIIIAPPLQSLGRKAVSDTLGENGATVSIANFVTDSFSVTCAALLAVWPIITYYFGIITLVAPLATLIALPALPAIIISGTLAGALGLIILPVAQAIGWLAWLFLSYMLLVVETFAAIPPITVGSIDLRLIWVYYSVLALSIWLNSQRKILANLMPRANAFVSELPKRWVIPSLMVLAALLWVTAATMPDGNLHISFLDVGQGDAILIQRGSQQVLIDGGPSPERLGFELGKQMPFWDRTIDLVVSTHPHADHITGLSDVLNRYQIKQVLYPDLAYNSPIYDKWRSLIGEKKIKYTLAQAGQQISLGKEVVIEVLNPAKSQLTGTESDIDNNGIVLRLSTGKVSFLFTADMMWESEFELISRRASLTSTVLKVAHHGSETSTTAEFLAMVKPRLAVISVGKDNPFGHPNKEVVARLQQKSGQENIYRTDEDATIEFITDGERLWVRVGR